MILNETIGLYLFLCLFLSGICQGTHTLIITDAAVIEATLVVLSNDYIPDDRDLPDILNVSYIAEIEIKKIVETGNPVFTGETLKA